MVTIGKIAIDGTKLKANASYRKTIKGADLNERMEAIHKDIELILREYEEIKGSPVLFNI